MYSVTEVTVGFSASLMFWCCFSDYDRGGSGAKRLLRHIFFQVLFAKQFLKGFHPCQHFISVDSLSQWFAGVRQRRGQKRAELQALDGVTPVVRPTKCSDATVCNSECALEDQ